MPNDNLPESFNDDVVLPPEKAAKVCNVSTATLTRRHKAGDGPPRIQLSPRRFGYRLRDLRAWLTSRMVQP